jgi:PleD family two-component response regulator
MSKGRILVVEDDFDISNMLRIYFQSQDYEVTVAPRGEEALELCRQRLPHVIVLDIMLPDIDGYEVCRRLRGSLRTSHVPIIFLTQKDERSDKIVGLELGADDYITKPFDIEELRLRVQGSIRRAQVTNLSNPTTGLPSGKQIEEQLRNLMRTDDWALLYVGINHIDPFRDKEGFLAGDEVLRDLAQMLGETVDEFGTADDFIGHRGGDDFVVITTSEHGPIVRDRIVARFNEGAGTHYNFMDREKNYIIVDNEQHPLMSLAVGMVLPESGPFADIREITEVAAELRRANEKRSIGRQ